jgi:hypothetical protein
LAVYTRDRRRPRPTPRWLGILVVFLSITGIVVQYR